MFKDRKEAGYLLVQKLIKHKDKKDTLVLALPRGGIVVGKEIAKALNLPLDVVVTRKIGAPENLEFAIAAVGSKTILKNKDFENFDRQYLQNQIKIQRDEINRRAKLYRQEKPAFVLNNKIIILVDDGIATGLTMKAAILEIKRQMPKKIILAIPVAPADTLKDLEKKVDEIIVLEIPSSFFAIGQFYENFEQVSDEEVIRLLK